MWLIALNVLAMLATVFPWGLGKPADALSPAPAGIHPEWYFMAPFQMLKDSGQLLPGLPAKWSASCSLPWSWCFWVFIPLFDAQSQAGQRGRIAHYFGIFAVTALILTTALGYWGIR